MVMRPSTEYPQVAHPLPYRFGSTIQRSCCWCCHCCCQVLEDHWEDFHFGLSFFGNLLMYRALQDWPTSLRTATSCCTWPADCRSCWTSPLRSWIAEAEMNQGQGGAGVGRNLSPSAETCITSNKTSWTRLVLIYFAVGRNIGHHVLVSLSCWPQSCRCQSMLEGWGMLKSRVSRVIVSRVSQFIVGWGDILDLREVNWGVVGVEDNIGVECEVGNIGILVARSNSLMLTFISLVIMRWARVRSLCMILWLWRYSTPETTWSKMFLASGSEKECLVFLILCQFNSLC